MYNSLYDLMQKDEPASTEEWADRLGIMRRGGADCRYLPQDQHELRMQLAALEKAGRLELVEGCWRTIYLPNGVVREAQRSLF